MEDFDLVWKNDVIGKFTNVAQDMWYLDGKLALNKKNQAKKFQDLMLTLDSKNVFANSAKGINAILKSNTKPEIKVIVLSLDKENNFFVKTV